MPQNKRHYIIKKKGDTRDSDSIDCAAVLPILRIFNPKSGRYSWMGYFALQDCTETPASTKKRPMLSSFGGKRENGETPDECAKREFREETLGAFEDVIRPEDFDNPNITTVVDLFFSSHPIRIYFMHIIADFHLPEFPIIQKFARARQKEACETIAMRRVPIISYIKHVLGCDNRAPLQVYGPRGPRSYPIRPCVIRSTTFTGVHMKMLSKQSGDRARIRKLQAKRRKAKAS